jgi:hypothetical protein
MSIVLRLNKGSQLTFEELDGNFQELNGRLTTVEGAANVGPIDYNDLINAPTLFSESYNDLTDKPALFSGSFNDLSGKPNTLEGYNITDAATTDQGTNADTALSWGNHADAGYLNSSSTIEDLANVSNIEPLLNQVLKWNGFEWEPANDAEGAGVAGGVDLTDFSVTSVLPGNNGSLSYNNLSGVFTFTPPDLSEYLTTVSFNQLTSTPSTIAGYGITDAFDGAFASLSAKPTTLTGYGITDGLETIALGDFDFSGTTIDTTGSAQIAITPDVVFNGSVSFTTLQSTGIGSLTLDSASNIDLTAADKVRITDGLFQIARLTSGAISAQDAINGDMVYNTDTNKFQGFANGVWVNLH